MNEYENAPNYDDMSNNESSNLGKWDMQSIFANDDINVDIPLDEHFNVASANECTGLTPALPENDAYIESYIDIFDVPLSPVVADVEKDDAY